MTIQISKISNLDGSPCYDCLIKMTCTKSFILKTACDPYKDFVKKIVKKAAGYGKKRKK